MSTTALDVFDKTVQTGKAQKVASSLPVEIRVLWPSAGEARATGETAEAAETEATAPVES